MIETSAKESKISGIEICFHQPQHHQGKGNHDHNEKCKGLDIAIEFSSSTCPERIMKAKIKGTNDKKNNGNYLDEKTMVVKNILGLGSKSTGIPSRHKEH